MFAPPASWSAKKQAAHLDQFHTQKPDLDNLEKAILDGLNRIAFADDSQVALVYKLKRWDMTSRTVVSVEAMNA